MANLNQLLDLAASQFRSLEVPEPIVHWGHPLMMAIVIFVLGSFVGFSAWRGRVVTDTAEAFQCRADHRKLAPRMFLFLAVGYTDEVPSLLMQHQAVLESPHFWTESILLVLLAVSSVISFTGFGRNQPVLCTIHAYLGSPTLRLLFFHAVQRLKLGLAI